ncbi:Uncharacterized membrane protein YeiB [Mesobacillus persicus]|uniref:Uncharacterized membrane protein YeiB n=1 Tax=Mesobacillus persicus TaxID=930146 RepID=A0A1H8A0M3_9BACI|nr:DUF418 domain-containing protein [Mesobacillus persicus]SEM63464.1 Uncharacterized membrane protein YeiB [Mesobacillus persicus]
MNSIETKDRIDTLDYLRGFALLGIILINIVFLLSAQIPSPDTLDAAYWKFLYLFVEGRFYTIFSFLFGIGFYLFISRVNAKGKNGTILFLRRILVMFLFGLVHYSFHPGEALTVYAVSGLLVLPFYKLKKEINLTIGLLLLLLFGLLAIKPLLPVALILLGLTAGQYRLFEDLVAKRRKFWWCTGILFLLSLMVVFYHNKQAPSLSAEGTLEMYWFYHIGIMVGPIVSAFYVGLFILIIQIPIIQKLLSPLKYYGRMALTNYVLQTVLILFAGYGLDLLGKVSYLQSLFICLAILASQLIFSILWLHFFRFGPLEWVWRMVTYLEIPPLMLHKQEDK